ncbi:DNA polymerase III subunit gamma/tau [Malacoplasma iowae]|uniref:DNA polymerase III subunit gamma/tau n=2 Tax=Malacoplasma iowae TaxID=2116 RepID=UPI002A18D737|nr:DNA polymerase III subunit gamma/tau [Malacoplasma iowae]WPL36880.1 DNA polymerase III subunit gamma/tau [Malacoplasma iowae]WPL38084.1 DNA polymerase III subunit gamma/tau [Malacoplasma iowae]WPL41465.1 DNA polymerase III subunit gamma/tau [Malacoplasma iowae]
MSMSVAFYRKYRPKSFCDVEGQSFVIQTLKNTVMANKVGHAYILSGPRGIGKTSIAKIFAKAINCTNSQAGDCCNNCPSCKLIDMNQTMDVVEMDAASNNGVNEVRSIIENISYLPADLFKKVYIIDEAHMLTTGAWNAFLKTLEEPPKHLVFIFATTEPHKFPLTILSRCQRLNLSKLNNFEIITTIKKTCENENIKIDDESLKKLTVLADGSARDALTFLNQLDIYTNSNITSKDVNEVFGLVDLEERIELIKNIVNSQYEKILNSIDNYESKGVNFFQLAKDIIEILFDKLIYEKTKNEKLIKVLSKVNVDFINIQPKFLVKFIELWQDALYKMKYASDQKFYFELTSLSASKIFDFDNFISVNDVKTNLNENKNNMDQLRKQVENKSNIVETQTINNKEVQFKQVALEDVFNKKVIGNKNNIEQEKTSVNDNQTILKTEKKEIKAETEIKKPIVDSEKKETRKEKQEQVNKTETKKDNKLELENKENTKTSVVKIQETKQQKESVNKKSNKLDDDNLVNALPETENEIEKIKNNKKITILDALINKSFKTNKYKLSQVKHNFDAQTKIKPETIVDAEKITELELKNNFNDKPTDNKQSKKTKKNNDDSKPSEPNLFTLDFNDNSNNDYLIDQKTNNKSNEINSINKQEKKQVIENNKDNQKIENKNIKENPKSDTKDELDLELEKKLKKLSSGLDREKLFFQIADNKNNDNKTNASQVLEKIKKSVTINADDVYFKEAKNILLASNNGMILLFENEVSAKNLNVVSTNPKFLVYLKNTFGKIYKVIGMTTETATELTEKYKQHLKNKKKLNDVEINDLIDKANKSNTTMKDLAISILGDEIEEE